MDLANSIYNYDLLKNESSAGAEKAAVIKAEITKDSMASLSTLPFSLFFLSCTALQSTFNTTTITPITNSASTSRTQPSALLSRSP